MLTKLTPPMVLAGLAAAGLAGSLAWAGWNHSQVQGPAGQVLGIVSVNRIQSLNPLDSAAPGTALLRTRLMQALREGLVEVDPVTQAPRAAGAETWEIAPDDTSVVLHLRPTARWSNGDPVVAQDYVFAIQLALTTHAPAADTLGILKNARAFSEGRVIDVRQVGASAVDAHTLRLDLEQPMRGLLLELCDIAWLPLHAGSAAALRDGSYWLDPSKLVTNGAFALAGASTDVISLRRNPCYYARDRVRLDGIDIRYAESESVYPRVLQAGLVQLSDRLGSSEAEAPLPRGVTLWQDPTLATGYIHFNLRAAPLSDDRVRRALSLALDRVALVRAVSSANVRPAYTCLPPIAGWERMRTVEEDLAEARRLLAEAGYPEGRGLPVLRWPFRIGAIDASQRLPEICADQWRRRLGVQVYVLPLDDESFQDRLAARDYDLVLAGLVGSVPDLAHIAGQLFGSAMRNYSGWDAGALPELVGVAREASGEVRLNLLLDVERAFLADMPATPVIFYNRHTLKHESVAGWYPDPTGLHPLKYLFLAHPVADAHEG